MPERAITVLAAGFGPFPGAARNPSADLVRRLSRRRLALAGIRLVTHVLATSYRDADRDLPRLIAVHRPQAVLLFGLAGRSRQVRIELQARNRIASFPDCRRHTPAARVIVRDAAAWPVGNGLCLRMLRAARMAGQKAVLSRDAGRYLCNYSLWRVLEARAAHGGPAVAAFVHIPPVLPSAAPAATARNRPPRLADLVRMAERIVMVAAAYAQQQPAAGRQND